MALKPQMLQRQSDLFCSKMHIVWDRSILPPTLADSFATFVPADPESVCVYLTAFQVPESCVLLQGLWGCFLHKGPRFTGNLRSLTLLSNPVGMLLIRNKLKLHPKNRTVFHNNNASQNYHSECCDQCSRHNKEQKKHLPNEFYVNFTWNYLNPEQISQCM